MRLISFIVRVDLLENRNYRYASWSKKSDLSDKPDLVINDGEIVYPDGSGGNHHFSFKNGEYNYIVDVTILGKSETPAQSAKNDKVILNQTEIERIKIKKHTQRVTI